MKVYYTDTSYIDEYHRREGDEIRRLASIRLGIIPRRLAEVRGMAEKYRGVDFGRVLAGETLPAEIDELGRLERIMAWRF